MDAASSNQTVVEGEEAPDVAAESPVIPSQTSPSAAAGIDSPRIPSRAPSVRSSSPGPRSPRPWYRARHCFRGSLLAYPQRSATPQGWSSTGSFSSSLTRLLLPTHDAEPGGFSWR